MGEFSPHTRFLLPYKQIKKMEEIAKDLNLIVAAFKLGSLIRWGSEPSDVDGYTVVYFDATKENNLKYYLKNKN